MAQRVFMRADLTLAAPVDVPGARAFAPDDVPALGELMYRAYLDTVDYEGETPEQAAEEVLKTVRGEYGLFVPEASRLVERAGALLSATLITRFQNRPFVAFTFSDPAVARQGLARACMQTAMSALFAQGERELRLVVTLANTPAVRLYRQLGFQVEAS